MKLLKLHVVQHLQLEWPYKSDYKKILIEFV